MCVCMYKCMYVQYVCIYLCTKVKVYLSVAITLLYGCETWTVYQRHIKQLDQFHMCCLRKIANVKWQDELSNAEV